MKLGKRKAVVPSSAPLFARMAAASPSYPEPVRQSDVIDWSLNLEWPLLANDKVGDCTVAAVLHGVQAAQRWTEGAALPPDTSLALTAYAAVSPYPQSDQGAVISDVLEHWRATGFQTPAGLNHISGYCHIGSTDHLKRALWLYGPLVVGADLPISAQTQDAWIAPADLTGADEPGSWGGHCMLLVAIDDKNDCTFVTWGQLKKASMGWVNAYMDEAWAIFYPEWVKSAIAPNGLSTEYLESQKRYIG